jgi:hypothetical protein
MNVFVDFHHASLLNSLIMLFEGRLGGNVYRPIGEEWAELGFWKIYDHPDTRKQYLSTDQGYRPMDGTPPLNLVQEVINFSPGEPTLYMCRDIESDKTNKAIDFATFKGMDIDIVIASVPQHVEPFKKLIREYKPNAKLIFQIGNAWTIEAAQAPNIMASAVIRDVPPDVNFVQYHQEFDLGVFGVGIPNNARTISSFINVHHDMPDYELFLKLEKLMQDWRFKSYGGQGRDGSIGGTVRLGHAMRNARFIWHVKAGGDGYGHVLFNAAAVGRPVIVKKSYYTGKLGEKLLIDGVTCINIDGKDPDQIVAEIERYSEPEAYANMCRNVYANFKAQVDFDSDFEQIKTFIDKLR